jgi:predicted acetyltransferase
MIGDEDHAKRTGLQVSLVDAWSLPAARDFVVNTWPMYIHDISAYGSGFYRLDASGRWLPDIVGDWVACSTPVQNLRAPLSSTDPAHPFQRAHVIMANDVSVGFACVGLQPFRHMPPEADVVLAEFFLIHASRGQGVGREAAKILVNRYPGRWHLSAIHDNLRAIRFWRKTLPLLGVQDLQEQAVDRDVNFEFVAVPCGVMPYD